jgi:hypothetical protein
MAVNVLSGESLETGQRKVQDKLQGIMFTAWKFWPLVHVITEEGDYQRAIDDDYRKSSIKT